MVEGEKRKDILDKGGACGGLFFRRGDFLKFGSVASSGLGRTLLSGAFSLGHVDVGSIIRGGVGIVDSYFGHDIRLLRSCPTFELNFTIEGQMRSCLQMKSSPEASIAAGKCNIYREY